MGGVKLDVFLEKKNAFFFEKERGGVKLEKKRTETKIRLGAPFTHEMKTKPHVCTLNNLNYNYLPRQHSRIHYLHAKLTSIDPKPPTTATCQTNHEQACKYVIHV